MKTIRTLADRRPDLVEIQIQAAKLYCREEYRHVVASTVDVEPFKDGHFEIRKKLVEICQKYGAEFLWFGGMTHEAALEALLGPGEDWALYLEEDVLPLAPFSIEQDRPAGRIFAGQVIPKTVQAWQERPAVEDWDDIPSRRVMGPDDLPVYFSGRLVDMYRRGIADGLEAGSWEYGYAFEILGTDDQFVHLDKCGGVCPAWFLGGKDQFAWALCEAIGIDVPAESFARLADTLTVEDIARHKAAVDRGAKPINDGRKCKYRGPEIERRKCTACKGTKIAVFECEILGQCSDKTDVGAPLCVNCDHFVDKTFGA